VGEKRWKRMNWFMIPLEGEVREVEKVAWKGVSKPLTKGQVSDGKREGSHILIEKFAKGEVGEKGR
jgi:hypothetical protein